MSEAPRTEEGPQGFYWTVRSVFRWILAGGYFFTVCPLLILMGVFVETKKNDRPQRWLSRWVVLLAGARFQGGYAAGFDPKRTCFIVSNPVNLFHPFVVYSTGPQFIRRLEL